MMGTVIETIIKALLAIGLSSLAVALIIFAVSNRLLPPDHDLKGLLDWVALRVAVIGVSACGAAALLAIFDQLAG